MSDKAPDLKTFDLGAFEKKQQELEKTVLGLVTAQKGMRDEYAKLTDGLITEAEFKERFVKINADIKTFSTDLEEIKNIKQVVGNRYQYSDYRAMLGHEAGYLGDDENGVPVAPVAYRAHALFQMPIEYDTVDYGQELRNLRNMHDACLVINAIGKFRHSNPVYVCTRPIWTSFTNAVEHFDPELAKVMHAVAGGNTGFGAEWLPTEFSAEFNEMLRIQPMIANLFDVWNIPRGASGEFPFEQSKPTVFKGSEALINNAAQVRKTNVGTGKKTFTPVAFVAALMQSTEITEDAAINMIAFIRSAMSRGLMEKLDSAIINGDTGTHQDNATETYWETFDAETAFIGLRAESFDNSKTVDIEVLSATTGVNALEVANFIEFKQLMNVAGVFDSEVKFITGPLGKAQSKNALLKEDALGTWNLIVTGQIPQIDGSDLKITDQYLEDQESDGLGDNVGAEKHTSITAVHTPSYRLAQRGGVTLEMDRMILTRQVALVAEARWDFGRVSSTLEDPVVTGINVQHTA